MNSSNLKILLNEYSRKRDLEITSARARKDIVFSKNPRLQEIENELTSHAISTAKSLLSSNDSTLIQDLNKHILELKKEKQEIYKKLNITPSYFEPNFSCKLCQDTGYITDGYTSEMCTCLKQKLFDIEYNKYNVYNMHSDTFDKFNVSYYPDEVDKSKYNMDISPRDNIKKILKISHQFISNFDNENEKNLLFIGNSGLGKTFLSNCIANELLTQKKTILYQTAPIMLDSILNYRLRKI